MRKNLTKFKFAKALTAIALLTTVTNYNPARASTATGSFTASTSVGSTCTFSVADAVFGSYAASTITANAVITVTCTNNTVATFTLTTTAAGAANSYQLVRANGSDANAYDVLLAKFYKEVGLSTQFYNGIAGITHTGTGNSGTVTIYGQIAAQGYEKKAGAYTKSITVTITYS
jgi:spore coat protein U-like protein